MATLDIDVNIVNLLDKDDYIILESCQTGKSLTNLIDELSLSKRQLQNRLSKLTKLNVLEKTYKKEDLRVFLYYPIKNIKVT